MPLNNVWEAEQQNLVKPSSAKRRQEVESGEAASQDEQQDSKQEEHKVETGEEASQPCGIAITQSDRPVNLGWQEAQGMT